MPVLVWLGKISYSMYLMHWIIGRILEFYQDSFAHHGHPLIGIIYILTVLLFSTLSYYLIETPCRQKINSLWK